MHQPAVRHPLGPIMRKLIAVLLFSSLATTSIADPITANAQRMLNQLGFDAGPVDGSYGGKTRRALEKFYESLQLSFDGILDDNEIGELTIALSNRPAPILITQPILKSSPECSLNYYSKFDPIQDYRFTEVGIDHDIETTAPRHYTGLGIAALNSEEKFEQLRSELVAHAKAMSFVNFDQEISVNRMIQPIIAAYGNNKSRFEISEQEEIENWFGEIIDGINRRPETKGLPRLHNITYRNALNQMLLGSVTNNQRRIDDAIRVYKNAINGMREDGSFPNDSQRGGSSLNYQSDATASLVTIAELAAIRGIDLYSFGGEKTIANAIVFTIDATIDPALISGYARTGPNGNELWMDDPLYDWKNPFPGWAKSSRAEFAFYWISRFPDSDLSQRLKKLAYVSGKLRGETNRDWSFDWHVAGSASCFTSGSRFN